MNVSRRQFLRGALGASVGLPFLASLRGTARAFPPKFPKRLVIFHTPNGSLHESWVPDGTETSFKLSPILEPLEKVKNDILVLNKIDLESSYHGPGGDVGHANGMGHLLTGTELTAGGYESALGGGISVDQLVANKIGKGTKLPSLELGVQASGPTGWIRMSYRGPNVSLPVENDPQKVFDRVFGSLGKDPLGLARARARKHSVLDAVMGEFDAVRNGLSSNDRTKLDNHLSAVRDLEKRLDTAAVLGGTCVKPKEPGAIDIFENANYPVLGKLQMDLLVMALACDITRVGSLLWAGAANNAQVFDWIGIKDSHHQLTHANPAASKDSLVAIMRWYTSQFAYLISALKAVPEGTGTMLDNTAVLWVSELSVGNSHNRREMPFVLAGKAGGYFKTGRFVTFPSGTPHNDLLLSLAQAMDVETKSIGNPAYCSGPLKKLQG